MTRTLSLALVAALAATATVDAAPIKRITKVSEFTGRQTPKVVVKPIVIQPLDVTGGQNLAAARKAVEDAIAKTQAELTDQGKLIGGLQSRLGAVDQRVTELNAEKAALVAQRDQLNQELNTLKGLSNPSQAILDCITELEGDIAQADAQIKNVDEALATMAERRAFLVKAGAAASNNEKKLKEALAHLKDALAAFTKISMPVVRPEIIKLREFKNLPKGALVRPGTQPKTPMVVPTPRPTVRRLKTR